MKRRGALEDYIMSLLNSCVSAYWISDDGKGNRKQKGV